VLKQALLQARRWAAFILLVASLIPALIFKSWLDAQAAAFVVLSTTIDTPVLNWVARAATEAPRVEEVRIAGQAATVAQPDSGERWPSVVFVNGATERGHLHPEVQRLARGLARAGYRLVVPELPGLRKGEITVRTLSALVDVGRAVADDGRAKRDRVGFVGVSVGASLALAAAESAELAGRVSAVGGIAPYADLRKVARMATTGAGYVPDDFVRLALARSFAAALPSAEDRRTVARLLAPIPNERDDPLAGIEPPRRAGRDVRALFTVLGNRDPAAFDRLWGRLPRSVRDSAQRLSPLPRARRLTMPVFLATAPRDDYFPVSESRSLARVSPYIRVTVTESLSHAVPEPSLSGVGATLRFNGFVVRGLRALR
jgi:dienelactone hydrolase